jgi:prepilin-type processing-associated H-X9-DG protein
LQFSVEFGCESAFYASPLARNASESEITLCSGGIIAICLFGRQSAAGFNRIRLRAEPVMSENSPSQPDRHRKGDRIVAALAVGSLVAVILMLVLPGNTVRVNGRRPQCQNDMRYVAIAFHTFAGANDGDLPMLHGIEIESDTNPDNAPYVTGWVTALLPFFELQELQDQLLELGPAANAADSVNSFDRLSATRISFLVCPDSPHYEQPGALSYVANMGYMTADLWDDRQQALRHQVSGTYNWNNGDFDANSPDDAAVSRATGAIMFDDAGKANSFDRMTDGQAQTILLAENLNAGPWISGHPHDIGFAVRIGGRSGQIPLATESLSGLGGGTPTTALQFHSVNGRPALDLGPSAINSPVDASRITFPRPSSVHPGCVNMFFCDGHGASISEDIDPTVYARLVSSGGGQYGQGMLADSDF